MKEQLFINNIEVELIKSLDPNLTFSINDISKPDKRKSNFSKTITLPGSKTINKLFEYIFNINIDLQTFNPNVKTDCLYLVDGETQIDGYLQLKEINILDRNDITYNVVIFGKLGNFITDLGDRELDDDTMLWGDLDHDYTLANQQTSWTATTGYVYPIIDYGTGIDWSDWGVTEIFPSIYAKEYIDRMFAEAGYTYQSSFFNSDPFDKLIVPFNGQEFALTRDIIALRTFTSSVPNFQATTSTSHEIPFDPSSNTIVYDRTINMTVENDPNNVYNTTTGLYQCNANGTYNLYYELDLTATFLPIDNSTGLPPTFDCRTFVAILGKMEMVRLDNLGNPIGGYNNTGVVGSKAFNISYTNTIPASTSSVTTTGTTYPDNDYIETVDDLAFSVYPFINGATAEWGTIDGRQEATPKKYILAINNIYLNNTDQIEIRIKANLFSQEGVLSAINLMVSPGLPYGLTDFIFKKYPLAISLADFVEGSVELNLTSGVFRNSVANKSYVEGNLIDMFSAIPKKIKQKDFFMSIVKMFNLFVQTNPNNEDQLIIETRNDFYNTDVNDWSQKLDNSQKLNFLPMGELDSSQYLYTYKPDKDYYNELYSKTWNEVYGERTKDIDNPFLNKEYKTEVIFSPTPSIGNGNSDMVLPSIKKIDNNGLQTRTQSNMRILYYGGLKNTIFTWVHASSLVADEVELQYPYCGHYDDPFTPTIDVNFGLTKEIYWDDTFNTITWTNNNLYNIYYSQFIEEITDINSKIVKGYFYLTPTDIRNLSFKELYFFENQYFRLNKIENYNPTNPVTKCEFLLINENNSFIPTSEEANGGVSALTINEGVPRFSAGINRDVNGNNVGDLSVTIQGNNNYVSRSAENIDVQGDDNYIFDRARNVTITGTNNRINGGVENVVLINTNNVVVETNNVTYINGVIRGTGSVVTITASLTVDESVTTYLCYTSSANIIALLPQTPTTGKTWNFKKVAINNELQLRVNSPVLIDETTAKIITGYNNSYTVQFDGTNYKII